MLLLMNLVKVQAGMILERHCVSFVAHDIVLFVELDKEVDCYVITIENLIRQMNKMQTNHKQTLCVLDH